MDKQQYEATIRRLALHAWDNEVGWPEISAWLNNFTGRHTDVAREQMYCLFALTRFMYFGKRLMREMLKSLYRDHFEAPLMQRIRRNYKDTRDVDVLREKYTQELNATRFIGVGNPAESGTHLLYYFRQVNGLPNHLFTDIPTAFSPAAEKKSGEIRYEPLENVTRYVFFDDIVGSGRQVTTYLQRHLQRIKAGTRPPEVRFMSLFATSTGLAKISDPAFFGAMSLFELDESYAAFEDHSRYFKKSPVDFELSTMKAIARTYGRQLWRAHPLGYDNQQLLLAFSHNTPNNVPPIFWSDGSRVPWTPVFMRFGKIYGGL
jgi:hypothetical protein